MEEERLGQRLPGRRRTRRSYKGAATKQEKKSSHNQTRLTHVLGSGMKKILKPRHIGRTEFQKIFGQFLRESIEIMRKARRETHEKYPDLFDHAK